MTSSDMPKKQKAAYQTETFEDLNVQEALTIIAVFAAQMVPVHCEQDVMRIEAIAEHHAEFVETKENILKRINKFANPMLAADDQLEAVEIAKGVFTPELRKTALIKRYKRYGSEVFVLMIDTDDFKQFNDVHGHQDGDRILAKGFGNASSKNSRKVRRSR